MMLNNPQAAQAVQGVVVPAAHQQVVTTAPHQIVTTPAAQQGMIAPVAAANMVPVVKAPVVAPQVVTAPAPVVVSPQVAETARRLNVSQPYQSAMNKSFNQFRKEVRRMPRVAGDRQVGPVNPVDQARINQLHKQYMAGIPAKTTPRVTAIEQPTPVAADVAKKTAAEASAADVAKKAAQTSKEISGTEAAGIALKKGAQATGEALGSGAKKAMEFAGENPVAGGMAAGAIGALGLRKLLRRNKSV